MIAASSQDFSIHRSESSKGYKLARAAASVEQVASGRRSTNGNSPSISLRHSVSAQESFHIVNPIFSRMRTLPSRWNPRRMAHRRAVHHKQLLRVEGLEHRALLASIT